VTVVLELGRNEHLLDAYTHQMEAEQQSCTWLKGFKLYTFQEESNIGPISSHLEGGGKCFITLSTKNMTFLHEYYTHNHHYQSTVFDVFFVVTMSFDHIYQYYLEEDHQSFPLLYLLYFFPFQLESHFSIDH